jgi:hypothetical protein
MTRTVNKKHYIITPLSLESQERKNNNNNKIKEKNILIRRSGCRCYLSEKTGVRNETEQG